MKKTIIVPTDFSDSAANALSYACKFARDYNLNILLVHIYSIPRSYAAEGLSLTTINDAMDEDRVRLKNELEHVKNKYSNIHFEAKMITGDFLETLQELKRELDPALIIMGAVMEYSELSLWDDDWLNALITVSCPVLVIPQHIAYSPILRIAYATDNKKPCLPEQTDVIKKLVRLSNASFYIVHITPKSGPQEENANTALNEVFSDIKPQYHIVENRSVIRGMAEFIKQYHIDLLLVMPRKHGLWHNLFNKSYTKQLALLNDLPVMAMHDND